MRTLVLIVLLLNGAASILILAGARGAIHEILAAVTFLVAAVMLGTMAVIGELRQLQEQLRMLVNDVHMIRGDNEARR